MKSPHWTEEHWACPQWREGWVYGFWSGLFWTVVLVVLGEIFF